MATVRGIVQIFIVCVFCAFSYSACAEPAHYNDLLKLHFQFLDLSEIPDNKNNQSEYIFKSPRSRTDILKEFCRLKTNTQKKYYFYTFDNIVKNGKSFQKRVNYNDETERAKKRQEENDPKTYNISQEPHSEAGYHLGVIYGFSDCGFLDYNRAIDYFQQAYNKPETYFMIAELYRVHNPYTHQRRIDYLYNDAIKAGITEAQYNLALYMYKMINSKKASLSNPQNFNYQTIIKHLRMAALSNSVAQNDLAIMLYRSKPNISQQKLYFLMNMYFAKASKQGFLLADYNQIIMTLSQECSVDNKEFLKQKTDYLHKKKFPYLKEFLSFLKNDPCFYEIFQKIDIIAARI